jgi:hypothetical protein
MSALRTYAITALLGLSAVVAVRGADDKFLRVWSAPGVSAKERAAAVNRCFTNGTPVSLIVARLGTNYTRFAPFTGWPQPLKSALSYEFGQEAVLVWTTASPVDPLLAARFTWAGHSVPARRGQQDGAANGSQPIRSGTNQTSSAAGSRR